MAYGESYVITSGKTAAASNALKVAVALATGAAVLNRWLAFDVSFDGTTATATPILVEIVRTTAASSGGSVGTIQHYNGFTPSAASSTARINDTADGTSPTVIQSWLINPTTAFSYQWPLGREFTMSVSSFAEIRLTTVTASGTPNYVVNLVFEE